MPGGVKKQYIGKYGAYHQTDDGELKGKSVRPPRFPSLSRNLTQKQPSNHRQVHRSKFIRFPHVLDYAKSTRRNVKRTLREYFENIQRKKVISEHIYTPEEIKEWEIQHAEKTV